MNHDFVDNLKGQLMYPFEYKFQFTLLKVRFAFKIG